MALARQADLHRYNLGRLLLEPATQRYQLSNIGAQFDAAEILYAGKCSSRVFFGSAAASSSNGGKIAPNVKGLEKKMTSTALAFSTVMAILELEERPGEAMVDYSEPARHFDFIRRTIHWLLAMPEQETKTLLVLYMLVFLYLLPPFRCKVCQATEGELARRFFNNFDHEFETDFCGDLDRKSTKSSVLKRCAKVPLEIAFKYIRRYEILVTDPDVYRA